MIITGVIELASKIRYGVTSRGVPIYLFVPFNKEIPYLIVGSSERDLSRNQIAIGASADDSCPPVPTQDPAYTGKPSLKIKLVDGASADDSSPPVPTQDPAPLKHLDRVQLLALLGPVGSHVAEVAGLLAHYAGVHGFRNTLKGLIPDSPDTKSDESREEISKETGWTVFTVDPPGCMDADDAIAFNPSRRMMAITIADVASVVTPGSAVDLRARELGATFYDLEGHVKIPMLPREISEESASLRKGQRRRGLTLLVHIQDDGPGHQFIARTSFQPSWITVEQSYTYESFAASPLYAKVQEQCPEEYKGIEDTHKWIEALMVLYNREAAAVLKRAGAGILRVQKKGVDNEALGAIDFRLIMEGGSYVAVDPGTAQEHASLGGVYCHASSPLRRYVDLVNQRILLGFRELLGPSEIDAFNERAKNNKRWTRDLLFLTFVTPGTVHTLEVVSLGDGQKVWVPTWGRRLTLRHEIDGAMPLGGHFMIQIFCDPTKRCWKERILTAPCSE